MRTKASQGVARRAPSPRPLWRMLSPKDRPREEAASMWMVIGMLTTKPTKKIG